MAKLNCGKIALFMIISTLVLVFPIKSYSFSVTVESKLLDLSDKSLTNTGNVGPFWRNTKTDINFNKENTYNYILFNVSVPGTFTFFVPSAPEGSIFKLFKVSGTNGESAEHIWSRYYPDENRFFYLEPGEYILKTYFNGAEPSLTMDFFPDNPSQECINLFPDSGFGCEESWSPVMYKREMAPFIDKMFNDLQLYLSTISDDKYLFDETYGYYSSLRDCADLMEGGLDPDAIDEDVLLEIDKLLGGKVISTMSDDYPMTKFTLEQIYSHLLIADDLFAIISSGGVAKPDAYYNVAKQISDDVASVGNNIVGIWRVQNAAERGSEIFFARIFLQTLLEYNFGNWDNIEEMYGTIVIADCIDAIAETQNTSNWPLLNNKYDAEKAADLVYSILNELGDRVAVRRTLDNPYSDVDNDGILNSVEIIEGTDPNNPADPPVPLAPTAKISVVSSAAVGTTVTVSGANSVDPDNGNIVSYQWTLLPPSVSSATLSSNSSQNVSFTIDSDGSYQLQLRVTDDQGLSSGAVENVVGTYNYNVTPITQPQQYILASATTYDQGPEGWSESWSLEVGENIKEIIVWRSGTSSSDPLSIAIRKNSPPTVDCITTDIGTEICFWDRYIEKGVIESSSREILKLENPSSGTYYIGAYSFSESFSGARIYYQLTESIDFDDDGVPNDIDLFPTDSNEAYDSDLDGVGDNSDAFPNDPAASVDSDDDGWPNYWNDGSNQDDSVSNLQLDIFPNDINEWLDSDTDGVGDNGDAFPTDIAASLDSDGDGYPDAWNSGKTELDSSLGLYLDAFPEDIAASLDEDGDGYPYPWNTGQSQETSSGGLILDNFPNDQEEWSDSDYDGVGDNSDWAVSDSSEWADSDGDGVGDNSDTAPNDPSRSINQAPTVLEVGVLSVCQNGSLDVAITTQDEDGDSVNLKIISYPDFVNLQNAILMVSPGETTELGEYEVVLKASDSYGGLTYAVVTINVLEACVDENNLSAPIAEIVASSTEVSVDTLVTLGGASSYDPDGDDITGSFAWKLSKPIGSGSQLSITTGETTSFTPDQAGSYSVTLTVSDGLYSDTITKTISTTEIYEQDELVVLEEGKIYIENIDIEACSLESIQSVTVPYGEIWSQIRFVYSSPSDLVIIASLNENPNFKNGHEDNCAEGYLTDFDADFIHDYYDNGTGIEHYWYGTFNPGDKIYISLFSYGGFSSGFGINGNVLVNKDQDGDGVPNEQDAFPNDSMEQYDSDGDGVGDNTDANPNDPNRTSNAAPSIQEILPQYVDKNESVDITIVATDDDRDSIHMALVSSPNFISLINNVLTVSPDENTPRGEYNISVKIYDDFGGIVYADILVTVSSKQNGVSMPWIPLLLLGN